MIRGAASTSKGSTPHNSCSTSAAPSPGPQRRALCAHVGTKLRGGAEAVCAPHKVLWPGARGGVEGSWMSGVRARPSRPLPPPSAAALPACSSSARRGLRGASSFARPPGSRTSARVAVASCVSAASVAAASLATFGCFAPSSAVSAPMPPAWAMRVHCDASARASERSGSSAPRRRRRHRRRARASRPPPRTASLDAPNPSVWKSSCAPAESAART